MELLLIHDTAEAEISNQQVGVVFWRSEQQVLWFEIAVDNSMVV